MRWALRMAMAAVVAVLLSTLGAQAQSWSVVSDYTPSGTAKAANMAAGGTFEGGWVDEYGSTWSSDSSKNLYTASTSNPWQAGIFGRPASESAAASQRMRITFTQGKGDVYAYLLHNGQLAGNAQGYAVGVSVGNGLRVYSVVGGGLTQVGGANFASAPVTGTQYVLDAALTRNADGTNSIAVTRYASDGATVIDTLNVASDGTTALKSASGRPAMFAYLNGATNPGLTSFQRVVTYNQTSTAYTLTGPASGGVNAASGNFTITPTSAPAADTIVTIASSVAGDTITPSTVTLTAGSTAAKTFTVTASNAGQRTISTTNNKGLTDAPSVTYTGANITILAVNSASFRFSPGNWRGDTGRGGSAYRQTWNSGAYFEVAWNASASPSAVVLIPSTSTGMIVSYVLNGVQTDGVAATGNIDISSKVTASAANTLRLYVRNNPQSARWNNGTNTLQVQGLQIDSGSTAGTAATVTGWDLIAGDSLTEGIQAAAGNDNFSAAWTYAFGQAVNDNGRDYSVNACGYSGWLNPGDSTGDVPAYYATSGGTYADASSRWNKVDSGVSLLDSAGQMSAYGGTGTAPTNIWLVQGTNEALQNSSTSDVTASVRQAMTALRAAAPSSKINIVIPFAVYGNSAVSNGAGIISAIKAGFNAYKSANASDTNVALIDFGASFSSTLTSSFYGGAVVHGNQYMHALEAARMIPKLGTAAANSNTPAAALPQFRVGFH